MRPTGIVCVLLLLVGPSIAFAQATSDEPVYGRRQTFAAFFDYSNDSSHIVLGRSPDRKFTDLGFQYEYRVLGRRHYVWKYAGEFRPLIVESDLTSSAVVTFTSPPPMTTFAVPAAATLSCRDGTTGYSVVDPNTGILYSETVETSCGRRWTYMEGLSPLGSRINVFPHSRWQPTASVLAGFLLSAKRIPVDTAGSFNFMFEFGAGLEYFRTPSQSMRVEYQVQHFSNASTADSNPGVDNGLFKLTYTFGR